jgi:hypothetical protein
VRNSHCQVIHPGSTGLQHQLPHPCSHVGILMGACCCAGVCCCCCSCRVCKPNKLGACACLGRRETGTQQDLTQQQQRRRRRQWRQYWLWGWAGRWVRRRRAFEAWTSTSLCSRLHAGATRLTAVFKPTLAHMDVSDLL